MLKRGVGVRSCGAWPGVVRSSGFFSVLLKAIKRHWSVSSSRVDWSDLCLEKIIWAVVWSPEEDGEVISTEAGKPVGSRLLQSRWVVTVAWTRVLRTKLQDIVRSGEGLGDSANRTCWCVDVRSDGKSGAVVGAAPERRKAPQWGKKKAPLWLSPLSTVIPACPCVLSWGAWETLQKPWPFLFIFGLPQPWPRSRPVSVCGTNGRHRGKCKIIRLERVTAAVLQTAGHVVCCKNKGCGFLATHV